MRVPPSRQILKSGRGSEPKKWVTNRDNVKLLNDDNNLELLKEPVKLIQQEQVQNSTAEHFVAVTVPTFTPKKCHDPNAKKLKWTACHKVRV